MDAMGRLYFILGIWFALFSGFQSNTNVTFTEEDAKMSNSEIIQFKHVIIDPESPENPHIKAVGDINGDGIAEVVAASSNGGPIVWYEYPNWTKHVVAPSGKWSCYAKVVDMDGDGVQDILISEWYTYNRMEWYENPAPKGNPATDSWKLHIIGSPRAHDIDIADIDGDGKMEIVTRRQGQEGNKIFIWKRNADGSWINRAIDCPAGEGLAIGNLRNDGKLDVIIGGRWYETPDDVLNDPWKEHVFADWHQDAVVKTTDMNRDGRSDIILTRSEGPYRISWFETPNDPIGGQWTEHVIDDSIDFAHSLAICDMDNDGELDVVTAEMHQSSRKRVMVYFNRGNALKWERQVLATTGSHNICVADVTGDGNPDIVGANWSGNYQPIEIWLNPGR
jgi:hypothetical protein